MGPSAVTVELHQPHRRDDVATAFNPRGDFTDQAAMDGVGFTEN
jgi:hypothetical protein